MIHSIKKKKRNTGNGLALLNLWAELFDKKKFKVM